MSPKVFSKTFVKGKKDSARARVHKSWSPGAVEGSITLNSPLSVNMLDISPTERFPLFSTNGDQQPRVASKFQFTAKS